MKVLNIILIVLIWLAVAILAFGEYNHLILLFSLIFLLGIVMLIISKKVSKTIKIISSIVLGVLSMWCIVFTIDQMNSNIDSTPIFSPLKVDEDIFKVYEGFGYRFEYEYEYVDIDDNEDVIVLTEINTFIFGKLVSTYYVETDFI